MSSNESVRVPAILEKKRDGEALTTAEIDFLISGYTKGEVPDYQMAAFCMAVFFRGMDGDEVVAPAVVQAKPGATTSVVTAKPPTSASSSDWLVWPRTCGGAPHTTARTRGNFIWHTMYLGAMMHGAGFRNIERVPEFGEFNDASSLRAGNAV